MKRIMISFIATLIGYLVIYHGIGGHFGEDRLTNWLQLGVIYGILIAVVIGLLGIARGAVRNVWQRVKK